MADENTNDLLGNGPHYDLMNRDRTEDIPFYANQARQHGQPVLELACGTGRITIPLAERGIRIIGLDNAESMLSEARRKAAECNVVIDWVESDCRDFRLDQRFSMIFLPSMAISFPPLDSAHAAMSFWKQRSS